MPDEINLPPAFEIAARSLAIVAMDAHEGNKRKARKELEGLRDTITNHNDFLYGAYCIAVMRACHRRQRYP